MPKAPGSPVSRRTLAPIPDPGVVVRAAAAPWSGILVLLALVSGCRGRSEESIRNEFDTYVAGANQCAVTSDCTLVALGCPLGCEVAVRADREADVSRKGRTLLQEYHSGGGACLYDCIGPAHPVCELGRCAIAIDSPPPGDGADAGDSPPPTALLSIEPADGTTAAAMRDITLRLHDTAGVVDDGKLTEVVSRAFLQTWPERLPVGLTAATLTDPTTNDRLVHLVPLAPLADRWYVAGLTTLPTGITYAMKLEDGTIGNRFRTGPHPRVAQLQFCEKAARGMKLVVLFSEPITLSLPPAEVVTLQVAGSPASCESYLTTADGLYFTCADLTADAKVAVSLGTGVQSTMSGVAIDAASWTVDVGVLPAGSCRSYSTPI